MAPAHMTNPLSTLRRHLRPVIVTMVAGAVVGAVAAYLIRQFAPLYRAEAVVNVRPPGGQEGSYEQRAALAGAIKSPDMMQAMLDPNLGRSIRETRWFRDILHEDAAAATQALEENLDAVAQRQSPCIVVSMATNSPREAALIAAEAARLFVDRHTPPPNDEFDAKLAELTTRQGAIEKEIHDQEATLQTMRQNARQRGIADPGSAAAESAQSSAGLRVDDLETQEGELTANVRHLEASVENLRRLGGSSAADAIGREIEQDPTVVSLTEQIAALQVRLSGQLTRLGEDHRSVRQTKEQIEETQAALRQRKLEIAGQVKLRDFSDANDHLQAQQARLAQLQQLREHAQQHANTLIGVRAEYEQARERRDERIKAWDEIKTQIEQLRVTAGRPSVTELQLMGPAPEPAGMVPSRSFSLWTLGGMVLGLTIGLIRAMLSARLNDLVRTPSDVRRFLRVPLLGVIPDAGEDRAVSDIDPYHIVRDAPYSLLGEAYRHCRTNLDVPDRAACKTLLIASGDAGDGKTSLACNLAAAFAAKEEAVLLIDANLRQPSLHLAFGRGGSQESGDQRRMGLTNILTGQCDYQAAIRTSRIAGLDLIYAGPPAPNPAELLAGRRMKDLIENAAKWYDHVIIDSPPVLLVSEVKVLAALASATLLVFNAATTHRGAGQRTIAELQEVGANVIGCVLFDVQALLGGYFRRQFQAYRNYLKPQLAASSA